MDMSRPKMFLVVVVLIGWVALCGLMAHHEVDPGEWFGGEPGERSVSESEKLSEIGHSLRTGETGWTVVKSLDEIPGRFIGYVREILGSSDNLKRPILIAFWIGRWEDVPDRYNILFCEWEGVIADIEKMPKVQKILQNPENTWEFLGYLNADAEPFGLWWDHSRGKATEIYTKDYVEGNLADMKRKDPAVEAVLRNWPKNWGGDILTGVATPNNTIQVEMGGAYRKR
jgi:hypothetical protein